MSGKQAEAKASSNQKQSDAYSEWDDLPPAYDASIGSSSTRPPHGPQLPQRPHQNHSDYGHPGSHYQQQPMPSQGATSSPNQQQYPRPQAPFNYPPGYFCNLCQNTGVKRHNGHLCGTCERNFGRQGGQVQYAPWGVTPVNGVTYMAGDPRIGGRLCGNCKGRGVRSSFLGLMDEQCMSTILLLSTCANC